MRQLNIITESIIGKAIEVHRTLGPGLLESGYETCLLYELMQAGFKVEQQKTMCINYKDITLKCAYRIDLLVEDAVVVELKTVETLLPVHKAQLLSYLKLTGLKVGLLINFNVLVLKQGIQRISN